ncbi:MAG: porin [Proteobacteria bacterium]|nr:porin [Pseudomonadota bacterium]
MNNQRTGLLAAIVLASLAAPAAHAIDVTAGKWTLSFDGNVNAHYIYSHCAQYPAGVPGTSDLPLACTSSSTSSNSSAVSNGLLPAALSVAGTTEQDGFKIGFDFGLYPGISTNDGGSPNLKDIAIGGEGHTALGTAGLDIRQVFLTVGNDHMGTIMAGRNIGLFASDVILNDMTLLGVGAGNGDYSAPANTSLGSIGLGYIYTDWLSQIDYTTPDMAGTKVTFGIFDPLNSLGQTPLNHSTPGFQAKIAYTMGSLYLSASGLYQQQRIPCAGLSAGGCSVASAPGSYDAFGADAFDIGGKYDFHGLEVLGWYYRAKGVGTTGLFAFNYDGLGYARDSDGFLAQITYTMGKDKMGVNYGVSKLDPTAFDVSSCTATAASCALERNSKWTLGNYYNLTPNLLVVTEFTRTTSVNIFNTSINSWNLNAGLFLKF